jgi:hypothetical protein
VRSSWPGDLQSHARRSKLAAGPDVTCRLPYNLPGKILFRGAKAACADVPGDQDVDGSPFQETWRSRWLDQVAANPEFRHASRMTAMSLALIAPDVAWGLKVTPSHVAVLPGLDDLDPQAPRFIGSTSAWSAFLKPMPAPHDHSVLGMARRRDDFSIDGLESVIRHLRVLTVIFEEMRTAASATSQIAGVDA